MVFNTLKIKVVSTYEKNEMKYCRRCSREITVILFQFNYNCISMLYVLL